MLRIVFFILILTEMCVASSAQAKNLMFVSEEKIAQIAAEPKFWGNLRKRCDRDLIAVPHPVLNFAPQSHYNANGANAPDESGKAMATDSHVAYRTALCFLLGGDVKYARKAQDFIVAYQKGMATVTSEQGASDVNFNFAQFVIAAAWVENVDGWDATAFKVYLKRTIKPLSHSAKLNNHGNWGVLLDATIAAFTQKQNDFASAKLRWSELMISQIADDGTMPLEVCRSNSLNHCGGADKGVNGLAYTHFALLPTAVAGQIFGADNFLSPAGEKLKRGFAKAAYWTHDPASFSYFSGDHSRLRNIDRCSYFAILQQHFPDVQTYDAKCSVDIYELKTLFP